MPPRPLFAIRRCARARVASDERAPRPHASGALHTHTRWRHSLRLGDFFVNLFAHFRPRNEPKWHETEEVRRANDAAVKLPPNKAREGARRLSFVLRNAHPDRVLYFYWLPPSRTPSFEPSGRHIEPGQQRVRHARRSPALPRIATASQPLFETPPFPRKPRDSIRTTGIASPCSARAPRHSPSARRSSASPRAAIPANRDPKTPSGSCRARHSRSSRRRRAARSARCPPPHIPRPGANHLREICGRRRWRARWRSLRRTSSPTPTPS